jgi:hypothetical protein
LNFMQGCGSGLTLTQIRIPHFSIIRIWIQTCINKVIEFGSNTDLDPPQNFSKCLKNKFNVESNGSLYYFISFNFKNVYFFL